MTKPPSVHLREFTPADLDAVHAFGCDPEVVRHMEWGPNSLEDSRAFLDRAIALRHESPRHFYERAIVRADTGELIGSAGIRLREPLNRSGDMGYTLHRAHWGKGYASEIAAEMVRFGFEEMKLHRLWATCRPENRASARVLEKSGLKYEGHLRHTKLIRGVWVDSLLFAMLEDDYFKAVPTSR